MTKHFGEDHKSRWKNSCAFVSSWRGQLNQAKIRENQVLLEFHLTNARKTFTAQKPIARFTWLTVLTKTKINNNLNNNNNKQVPHDAAARARISKIQFGPLLLLLLLLVDVFVCFPKVTLNSDCQKLGENLYRYKKKKRKYSYYSQYLCYSKTLVSICQLHFRSCANCRTSFERPNKVQQASEVQQGINGKVEIANYVYSTNEFRG